MTASSSLRTAAGWACWACCCCCCGCCCGCCCACCGFCGGGVLRTSPTDQLPGRPSLLGDGGTSSSLGQARVPSLRRVARLTCSVYASEKKDARHGSPPNLTNPTVLSEGHSETAEPSGEPSGFLQPWSVLRRPSVKGVVRSW